MDVIVKGTLVLVAGYALASERRRISAAIRDVVWTASFGFLLLLPILSPVTPAWDGPVTVKFSAESVAATGMPATAVDWLGWVWLAGFTATLGRLLLAHARAAVLTRRAAPLPDEGLGARLRQMAAGTMPMTWGFLRPVILVPADAEQWTGQVRQSVLRHELAHVRRGDVWKQLLTQAACCLWWFHPLAWTAMARAARAREQACDDAVLKQGAEGTTYAEHLIEVARNRRTLAAAAAPPFGSQLENRILAVLDGKICRRAVQPRTVIASLAMAAVLVLPFSGMRLWAAEEVHRVDEPGVVAPRLIEKSEPAYTQEAKDAGIEGTVVLYVEITTEGKADNISVTESLDGGLDANAIAAIRQWEFEPGTKNGKPARIAATIEVNFRLL